MSGDPSETTSSARLPSKWSMITVAVAKDLMSPPMHRKPGRDVMG